MSLYLVCVHNLCIYSTHTIHTHTQFKTLRMWLMGHHLFIHLSKNFEGQLWFMQHARVWETKINRKRSLLSRSFQSWKGHRHRNKLVVWNITGLVTEIYAGHCRDKTKQNTGQFCMGWSRKVSLWSHLSVESWQLMEFCQAAWSEEVMPGRGIDKNMVLRSRALWRAANSLQWMKHGVLHGWTVN